MGDWYKEIYDLEKRISHICDLIWAQKFETSKKYEVGNYTFSVYRPEKATDDDFMFDIVVIDKSGKPIHDELSLYGGDIYGFILGAVNGEIHFHLLDD